MDTSRNLSIRIETQEKKVRAELASIISALPGFEIIGPNGPDSCDLLILDIGDDPDTDFQRLATIRASGNGHELFLTSASTDPQILIRALRSGVKEFIPQPVNQQEVVNALLKLKGRKGNVNSGPIQDKKGKIIDILGVKGGVGTTTIAVNLAGCLANLQGNPSVALIDLNLLLGEVPLFLNIKPVFDWMEVAKNISRLDATYLMSVLLKHSSGIHVLPSPARLLDEQTPSPKVIETLLKLMQQLFDFIIVDSGRSVDDISKVVLKAADRLVLVATPSLPCTVNLKRLLDAFQGLGFPPSQRVEIVANRSNQKTGVSLQEVEQTVGKKFSWHLPNDYRSASSAINNGEPLSVVARGSELSGKITAMALALAGKAEREVKAKRALFFGVM
jgi:pilus assembly protein CpaE